MAAVRLFKMLIMMHCVFIRGRYNSTFSQFNRGSQKKSTVSLCVYAFDNVDNSGRPPSYTYALTEVSVGMGKYDNCSLQKLKVQEELSTCIRKKNN